MSDTDSTQSSHENEEGFEEDIVVIEDDIASGIDSDTVDSDTDSDEDSLYTHYFPTNPTRAQIDSIYREECVFLDSKKENHRYYLGFVAHTRSGRLLLNTAIQSKTFLKYPVNHVLHYLKEYSIFYPLNENDLSMEIMQLNLEPHSHWQNVLIKTFWLRIIQRTWKRVFRERKTAHMNRGKLANLRQLELTGKHSLGIRVLPGLYGMLRHIISGRTCLRG